MSRPAASVPVVRTVLLVRRGVRSPEYRRALRCVDDGEGMVASGLASAVFGRSARVESGGSAYGPFGTWSRTSARGMAGSLGDSFCLYRYEARSEDGEDLGTWTAATASGTGPRGAYYALAFSTGHSNDVLNQVRAAARIAVAEAIREDADPGPPSVDLFGRRAGEPGFGTLSR